MGAPTRVEGRAEFHADIPEHNEWKRKVLAGEVEPEELDTTPFKDRGGVGKGVTIDKLVSAG